MKIRLATLALVALAQIAPAQEATAVQAEETDAGSAFEQWREEPMTIFDATEIDIEDFLYVARPVVVFADRALDPDFQRQIEVLQERPQDLIARDVVIVTDTDPTAQSDLRQRLRPRGFMVVLMGKDHEVEQRKPFPRDTREITRSIDKMP